MSNVKKGDLAIKIGGPNLGALVHVIDYGSTPDRWRCIPQQDVQTLLGDTVRAGEVGQTLDAWLRPLRGDPPAEVERIGDTQPSDVEVLT